MRVFQAVVQQARKDNPDFRGSGTLLGVGLLVGYMCLLHGIENGPCETSEFLAIDDEDKQHERLVKFYRQAGFKVIKYVGDDWRDIPDRMIWGGCGTLLRQDTRKLLVSWTQLMEKARVRMQTKGR
jgi:hypothetical protein